MAHSRLANGISSQRRESAAVSDALRGVSRAIGGCVCLLIVAHPAFAQSDATPASLLQAVVTLITGQLGQMLAVLAIMACGVAWMFGRASLGLIAGVIGGIVIIFGASYIASQLTGGAA